MTLNSVHTFTATIYVAGDIANAKQLLRQYTLNNGMCVTIEPTTFIYTGGEESGFRVGLINYPRFPSEPSEIRAKALDLADLLRGALAQHSFAIVMPDETIWNSLRHPANSLPPLIEPRARDANGDFICPRFSDEAQCDRAPCSTCPGPSSPNNGWRC